MAYEREFDGEASTSLSLPSDLPRLKGNTGIGEVGVTIDNAKGLSVDLGVQGCIGARRDASGSVSLKYVF